ncbi:MAG: hypothetical protein QFF03_17920 [Pseudomonadota bacterium]|nr:hypothetical protein [Pseudomonadota bacterium]
MAHETTDRKVNTDAKVANDGVKRMPHERDESPDDQHKQPRGVMQQAAADLAQGLVDTDLHATPGAAPAAGPAGQARPQPGAADGMRDQPSPTPSKEKKQQ